MPRQWGPEMVDSVITDICDHFNGDIDHYSLNADMLGPGSILPTYLFHEAIEGRYQGKSIYSYALELAYELDDRAMLDTILPLLMGRTFLLSSSFEQTSQEHNDSSRAEQKENCCSRKPRRPL